MILASVANLNIYNGDWLFEGVMAEINAAQEEGLKSFEIDCSRLENEILFAIIRALNDSGYIADWNTDTGMLEVTYDE